MRALLARANPCLDALESLAKFGSETYQALTDFALAFWQRRVKA